MLSNKMFAILFLQRKVYTIDFRLLWKLISESNVVFRDLNKIIRFVNYLIYFHNCFNMTTRLPIKIVSAFLLVNKPFSLLLSLNTWTKLLCLYRNRHQGNTSLGIWQNPTTTLHQWYCVSVSQESLGEFLPLVIMSELQATVEVSVEFHNFYNVDLFQRG